MSAPERTYKKRSYWGRCPKCGAQHGEPCTRKTAMGTYLKIKEAHNERDKNLNPNQLRNL
jgi:hypothetical protein